MATAGESPFLHKLCLAIKTTTTKPVMNATYFTTMPALFVIRKCHQLQTNDVDSLSKGSEKKRMLP